MTIGDRIKKLRLKLGMTQEELAKKVGYKSRSSINKIELGERDITQSNIVAFAYALKTTPSYLMGWEEEGNSTASTNTVVVDDDIRRIERARQRMPEEKWKNMMNTVKAAFGEYFDDSYIDDDIDE